MAGKRKKKKKFSVYTCTMVVRGLHVWLMRAAMDGAKAGENDGEVRG